MAPGTWRDLEPQALRVLSRWPNYFLSNIFPQGRVAANSLPRGMANRRAVIIDEFKWHLQPARSAVWVIDCCDTERTGAVEERVKSQGSEIAALGAYSCQRPWNGIIISLPPPHLVCVLQGLNNSS